MADKIKPPSNFGTTGPRQPRTPAPRRDAPGSVGAFDPVRTTSGRPGDLRRVGAGKHGDYISNSKDPVLSTHVADHILNDRKPPDATFGHKIASDRLPHRSGTPKGFEYGDAGKGVNYAPKKDAGNKV
jgi:hypothetical protein